MAAAVQSMQGAVSLQTTEGVHLFGIRHLSPNGAWHLLRFLDEVKPERVLIEGPADASDLIPDVVKPGVKPPLAVLCYTAKPPVRSLMIPLAEYSPEYQAMVWAKNHRIPCRFIDLPAACKLPISHLEEEAAVRHRTRAMEQEEPEEETAKWLAYRRYQTSLYEDLAACAGEPDFESYWERNFEQISEDGAYQRAVAEHSFQMRSMTESLEYEASELSTAVNALRESHMKRCILDELQAGTAPSKIVVICGAYHVGGLSCCDPMTDEERAALPFDETKMTLMPYSYYKLSTFSGYGAGNDAPYYFELMWKAIKEGAQVELPARYLARLSGLMREKHGYSSTATAIEAVRLAEGLGQLQKGPRPTLSDLHDSAVATMAWGAREAIALSFAALDVGTRIGTLPDGVSQTPIQDDMNRELRRLKLEPYKSVVSQTLALDLRENRRVKREEAAFLDLHRSVFLSRLHFLGIGFASPVKQNQDRATWAEAWNLCWTPEVEIQLVESVLYGETIESAAAYLLRERLLRSEDVTEVSSLVRMACDCHLPASVFDALSRLQSLTAESENLHNVTLAAREISFLLQYGSVRRFDTEPLKSVLQQLFLKAALLLLPAASCDDTAAATAAADMSILHLISQEQDTLVSDETWLRQLALLSVSGEKHPMLSGFACSILMERSKMTEDELGVQVSRYLSRGSGADTGARWFEGLAKRNRYLLLSRPALWQQLDGYLETLDEEEFRQVLVSLRRAFSSFEPAEKTGVCELLAELWGVHPDDVSELLQDSLSEEETRALEDLSDFDFGDL